MPQDSKGQSIKRQSDAVSPTDHQPANTGYHNKGSTKFRAPIRGPNWEEHRNVNISLKIQCPALSLTIITNKYN